MLGEKQANNNNIELSQSLSFLFPFLFPLSFSLASNPVPTS